MLIVLELVVANAGRIYYLKVKRTEQVTEQERSILIGQLTVWLLILIFVPLWIASIFMFGYTPLFSIYSVEFSASFLGLVICLAFTAYITVSSVKNQILIFTGRASIVIIRGVWAIVLGITLLGAFMLPFLSYL